MKLFGSNFLLGYSWVQRHFDRLFNRQVNTGGGGGGDVDITVN